MRELPQRKPNRLRGYDYSQCGAYFITVCAKDRHELFGSISLVGADTIRPQLSDIGMIVENAVLRIPQIYNNVTIDCYVIMPNHVHIIIFIANNDNGGRMISAPTLPKIIGYFKQNVSRTAGFSPWQKSFHDHIIRNDKDYIHIAEYIENNPAKWKEDCFYTSSS